MRQTITLLTVLLVAFTCAAHAAAQTGASLMTNPFPDGKDNDGTTEAMFIFSGRTDNQSHIRITRTEDYGRFLLDKEGKSGLSLGYADTYIDIDSNDPALPPRMFDISMSLGMNVGQVGDWLVQIVGGAGYAGTRPFKDGSAVYGKGELILTTRLDDRSALRVMLNYDGNRSIWPDVPLPSIAYTRRASESLVYTIGLPFSSVQWEPDDRLSVQLTYVFPYSGSVKATYSLADELAIYAALKTSLDQVYIDDASNKRRIFYRQRTVEVGAVWTPYEWVDVFVAFGYAFDRRFQRGWDVRDLGGTVDLSDEPFVRVGAMLTF